MTKILIDEAVVRQALEALETAWENDPDNADGYYFDAATALREALAEQPRAEGTLAQQEPVAWMYEGDAEFDGNDWRYPTRVTTSKQVAKFHGGDVRPLYTSPQVQLAREPLTDEEIEKLREKTFSTGNPYCPVDSKSMRKAARAIEAAHGITKGGAA